MYRNIHHSVTGIIESGDGIHTFRIDRQGLDELDELYGSSEWVKGSNTDKQGCSELVVASKTYHNSILNAS